MEVDKVGQRSPGAKAEGRLGDILVKATMLGREKNLNISSVELVIIANNINHVLSIVSFFRTRKDLTSKIPSNLCCRSLSE